MAVLPKVVHTSCANVHKLGTIALRFNIKCCLRFCIVDQIVGPAAKFWGVVLAAGSHAQTRAPGKSGSKIDRRESHHQDWRSVDEEAGNNIFASSCPTAIWRAWVNVRAVERPPYTYSLYSLYTAFIPASICSACRQPI